MKMIVKFGGVENKDSKEEKFSFITGSGAKINDYRMNFDLKVLTIFLRAPEEIEKAKYVDFLKSHKDFIDWKD